MRIECPTCKTSYTEERCGVPPLKDNQSAKITVVCLVCKSEFDTSITPKIVVVQPGWWQRVVLRRPPTTKQDGFNATVTAR